MVQVKKLPSAPHSSRLAVVTSTILYGNVFSRIFRGVSPLEINCLGRRQAAPTRCSKSQTRSLSNIVTISLAQQVCPVIAALITPSQWNHLRPRAQRVEIVRPRLHHRPPLVEIFGL